jgi:hypothetical protein
MAKYTIVISKSKDVRTTYVNHGVRNPWGGFFGTADAGWSFKHAADYELSRLPLDATEYDVEINGKITQSGKIAK